MDFYFTELTKSSCTLPSVPEWAEPVWHLLVVRHHQRDTMQKTLSDLGIQTIIHYPIPPHLSDAYRFRGWKAGDFPVAEKMSKEVLSLPLGPHLDKKSVSFVCEAIHEAR